MANGRAFEIEIAKLLRAADFHVTPDTEAARPRQTDLFARGDGIDLLIEAKNRKRNVDVGDIDALRSRLARTTSDVVGLIVTTSKLSSGAVEAIEIDRRREILAIVKEEVDQLRSGTLNLKVLIDRKREELRVHGKAWFGPLAHSQFLGVQLPSGSVEFRMGRGIARYFESRSNFAGASYALQIPDSGWGNLGSEGARLSMLLTLNDVRDLRDMMGYLHEKFGLSSNGMFSIHQSESCWNGIGAEDFLRTAEGWRERYAQSPSKTFHHSEEIRYFDRFRNGWMELSSQQRVDQSADSRAEFLHHSELVIQLPGVPVDNSAYSKLCRYTGNDWAHFEYVGQRLTTLLHLKRPISLRVLGTATNVLHPIDHDGDERIVVGLIARNPFYRRKLLPQELLQSDVFALNELRETELILCSLRDWHGDVDVVDKYVLEGFELTVTGAGQVVRPFGTWNKISKRFSETSV